MRRECNSLLLICFSFIFAISAFPRCRVGNVLSAEFFWPRFSWVTATHTTHILLRQPLGLMGAIKEKTQAINSSSWEPNCRCAALGHASDINENMMDHMWSN